jgi:hypothetical protein
MDWEKIKEAVHLGKLNSSDVPTGVFGVAGIILLLVAFKSGKFLLKLFFAVLALALVIGAVWWHLHLR